MRGFHAPQLSPEQGSLMHFGVIFDLHPNAVSKVYPSPCGTGNVWGDEVARDAAVKIVPDVLPSRRSICSPVSGSEVRRVTSQSRWERRTMMGWLMIAGRLMAWHKNSRFCAYVLFDEQNSQFLISQINTRLSLIMPEGRDMSSRVYRQSQIDKFWANRTEAAQRPKKTSTKLE